VELSPPGGPVLASRRTEGLLVIGAGVGCASGLAAAAAAPLPPSTAALSVDSARFVRCATFHKDRARPPTMKTNGTKGRGERATMKASLPR